MDDKASDDGAIEILDIPDEEETGGRPLMLLLKCLIRNKQNTVMTNTQIMEILKQEFDINIDKCHELEVDIYIKIIKKYLKDWPQWEDLEHTSSKLNNTEAVTKVLNSKYKNLKEYLRDMLDIAKPLAKEAVSEVTVATDDTSDVVMEVYCTREQLNHLIFRKPRTDLNNTIFNINKIEPTRISLNTLSLETIINVWPTKIHINLPNFVLNRELEYKFTHKLVNRVREDRQSTDVIDTKLYHKYKNAKDLSKATLCTQFYKVVKLYEHDDVHKLLQVIFNVLKTDIKQCAEIKIGASYRQFANKYKYVRYLYVDNTENKDKTFDLQLEEMMAPCYHFNVVKLWRQTDVPKPSTLDWLKIECTLCKIKFQGSPHLTAELQAHYNDCHQHEAAWQCSVCKKTFTLEVLAANRWHHEC